MLVGFGDPNHLVGRFLSRHVLVCLPVQTLQDHPVVERLGVSDLTPSQGPRRAVVVDVAITVPLFTFQLVEMLPLGRS